MASKQLRINISAWDNGSGLSADIDILTDLFKVFGCRVWVNGRKQRTRLHGVSRIVTGLANRLRNAAGTLAGPIYDANIFIENINPEDIALARVNCLIPDPEWLGAG